MPALPLPYMAESVGIIAVVLALFGSFVWWRIDNLERQLTKRLDENARDAEQQRAAIKEFWQERWPRVEVLESEVHSIRDEVKEVRVAVGRLQETVNRRG